MIPAVYVLSCVPAILAGRNMFDPFTIYLTQTNEYKSMSSNAPSIWSVIYVPFAENPVNNVLTIVGIALAGAFVIMMIIKVYQKSTVSANQWKDIAYLFVLVIPFLLPRMHERYFYAADIFSVIYGVTHKKRWFIPVLNISASCLAYIPFLYNVVCEKNILVIIAAVLMMVTVIYTIVMYFKDYYKNSAPEQPLQKA